MILNKIWHNYLKGYNRKLKSICLIILCFCSVTFSLATGNAYAGGVTIITHGHNGLTENSDAMYWVGDLSNKVMDRISAEYNLETNDGGAAVARYYLKVADTGSGTASLSLISQSSFSFDSATNTTGHTVILLDWTDFSGNLVLDAYGEPTGDVASWIVDWLAGSDLGKILFASPTLLVIVAEVVLLVPWQRSWENMDFG